MNGRQKAGRPRIKSGVTDCCRGITPGDEDAATLIDAAAWMAVLNADGRRLCYILSPNLGPAQTISP